MTRQLGAKDRGHYGRKTIWIAYKATVLVVLVPLMLCWIAGEVASAMPKLTSRVHRWAHPCLYVKVEMN
jgi:hypothetical protein